MQTIFHIGHIRPQVGALPQARPRSYIRCYGEGKLFFTLGTTIDGGPEARDIDKRGTTTGSPRLALTRPSGPPQPHGGYTDAGAPEATPLLAAGQPRISRKQLPVYLPIRGRAAETVGPSKIRLAACRSRQSVELKVRRTIRQ